MGGPRAVGQQNVCQCERIARSGRIVYTVTSKGNHYGFVFPVNFSSAFVPRLEKSSIERLGMFSRGGLLL